MKRYRVVYVVLSIEEQFSGKKSKNLIIVCQYVAENSLNLSDTEVKLQNITIYESYQLISDQAACGNIKANQVKFQSSLNCNFIPITLQSNLIW